MKRVIVIGASGKIGKAALSGLGHHDIVTASGSGKGCDYQVDIGNPESIRDLFKRAGPFDAVVNTVGVCEYADFAEMTEQQWMTTVMSKMIGSFSLISGILSSKAIPMAIADATTSGAIDTFVKCVAYEMPRGIRINAINPTVIDEAWPEHK